MLSVPTLWLVFVVNFTALGLIWTYVARSYPNFSAAPFWAASAFIAALGAAVSMLRGIVDSILPLLGGRHLADPGLLPCRHRHPPLLRPGHVVAPDRRRHGFKLRRPHVLHRRGRPHADADLHLFAGDVDPDGDDAETVAVADQRPRQSRRPACRHHRDPDPRHQCHPRRRRRAAYRRRSLYASTSTNSRRR